MDSNHNRDALAFTSLIWFTDAQGFVTAAFANVREARAWAVRNEGETVHFSYGGQLQAYFAMKLTRGEWESRLLDGVAKLREFEARHAADGV